MFLSFAGGDQVARRVADAVDRDLLKDPRWRRRAFVHQARFYERADRSLLVRDLGEGALAVGDLFDAEGHAVENRLALPDGPPELRARAVLDTYWGRYILIFRSSTGSVQGVLRAPSLTADLVVWRHEAVTVVATELPHPVIRGVGPRRGLDWSAIHGLLADPIFGNLQSALEGVTLVPPGALMTPEQSTFRSRQLWRPETFARDTIENGDTAAPELRRRVDASVAALARPEGAILTEVSGGFDSSIVAGSLLAANVKVSGWINHVTHDPSGDERLFARALGRHLGIHVQEEYRPVFVFNPALLELSQTGPRPSAFALDTRYDAYTIDVARRVGASRLFTGFGGDGLFWMAPLPEIARDLFLRRGARGLCSAEFADLARWCRKSVWAMAGLAFQAHHPALDFRPPPWVTDPQTQATAHPWLEGADDLPPAKKRHIIEQVLAQLAGGASLRGTALDVVHPLLAQPVLEVCLRIPVDVLVAGGRDRALARRAFRDRLPAEIYQRRSKGEMGAYYGEAVSAGLPELRAYLLDGRLRQQGLVRAQSLERVLDENYLAQHGEMSSVLYTAAIEAWVRRWEAPSLGVSP